MLKGLKGCVFRPAFGCCSVVYFNPAFGCYSLYMNTLSQYGDQKDESQKDDFLLWVVHIKKLIELS